MAGRRLNSVASHVGRRPPSALGRGIVPKIVSGDATFETVFEGHLKWMRQKYALRQDMFLIGNPGSTRRRLAYHFCVTEGLQPELLVITRDTVEADLRQRREIGVSGQTLYVDSAVVRAAVMGRVLILDGIEKAERNVLPTINNLLENREMVLDDGRCLLNHTKYDRLVTSLGKAEVASRNLVRVSPNFIVIALGLPVPPCVGHTLDPPLRSRFQGRVVGGSPIGNEGENASLRDFVDAIGEASELPLMPSDAVVNLEKIYSATSDLHQAIARVYPWMLFTNEDPKRGVESILSSLGISQSTTTGGGSTQIDKETGFVSTPAVKTMLENLAIDWRNGLDRRATDLSSGASVWLPSAAVRAAIEGKLLILDGLHRVPSDVLCALGPLIADRQCPLQNSDTRGKGLVLTDDDQMDIDDDDTGPEVVHVHPNFRIIAIANPPTQGNPWLTSEVMGLFSFHVMNDGFATEILSAKYNGSVLEPTDVSAFLSSLLSFKTAVDGCQGIPPFTLRRLLRIAKNCSGESPSNELIASVMWRQLLLDLVPAVERDALPKAFIEAALSANASRSSSDEVTLSELGGSVVISGIEAPKYSTRAEGSRPELVPHVRDSFVPIPSHKRFMSEIHADLFLRGERHLLIVGPQGVGKNKVIDYYMELLGVERYYMQLHRDSTVGSLTCIPELEDGRWIVLDEADKAPLEVVILLKSLLEDGYLNLPDGRILGGQGLSMPIHPHFKCVVLCNRPGFPFLGNDFFRECGDVFSVFLLDNPDKNSELELVRSVAPKVPMGVLSQLVSVFGDLRQLTMDGLLSYPFSTRELLASARHMEHFGRSDEALQGVLAFERWDTTALNHIRRVLERHGFPSKAILDGFTDSSAAVLLQEAELLPPLRPVGSVQITKHHQQTPGPWLKAESRTIIMEPSMNSPLKSLEQPRSVGAFTEKAASLQLPLIGYPRQEEIVDAVASPGQVNILCDSMTDGMRLYTVDTNNWECSCRSLGISAMRWRNTTNSGADVSLNGQSARSRGKPQVVMVNHKVYVWHPTAGILVELPESAASSRGVVHRLFGPHADLFVAIADKDASSSTLSFVGSKEVYEVDVTANPPAVRLILRSADQIGQITNIASGSKTVLLSNARGDGLKLEGGVISIVHFPMAPPLAYDFANNVYQRENLEHSYFYRIQPDQSVWVCPGGGGTRGGFSQCSIIGRSGTLINYRLGQLEIVDTVEPASVRRLPLRDFPVELIREIGDNGKILVIYTDGWVDLLEIMRSQLELAEKEYRHLRSLPTREDHKTASGEPKHGKEDNAPHVGGNTYAGGTGGADTAGLGGVGGPYRLDKGHPVHQVSDEVKASISPEAAEAARKMGQEALRKRLEEIKMSSADWQRYTQLMNGVGDEIQQLRRVLHNSDSRLRERKWLAGSEGELDENKLVDALAGDKRVYRRRALQEPKVGEPQILPKRLSIVLDVSASMYRFNGVDGRLKRMTEIAVLLLEALNGFEDRFLYEIRGHSGDGPAIRLVDFEKPPKNEKEKYRVIQEMCAHAQYCSPGDSTLEAIQLATDRLVNAGPADEKLLMAFSDANLDRYDISPKQMDAALNRAPDQVHSHVFFIASFDDQADVLCQSISRGKATTVKDLRKLPQVIKNVLAATIDHQK
ncbi:von Willebrand factor A domain-containing protein 8 [Perkinsus chesapeaki]|uniref:von Willebrand factor A domain-containing protein 8 n=1 Tax=Perkinsus chesapeaki TaxID=330153 RepID=A0A7J6MVX9_PERCH|nr:von Willebrand factor A domain-containing protein 8 [Perkinsus chesapeaki]